MSGNTHRYIVDVFLKMSTRRISRKTNTTTKSNQSSQSPLGFCQPSGLFYCAKPGNAPNTIWINLLDVRVRRQNKFRLKNEAGGEAWRADE